MLNTSSLGELAEQMFTVRAIANGYRVSRPIGHASSYDFIIDKDGALFRIQVKSTSKAISNRPNSFQVGVARINRKGMGNKYKENAFDYYAIYISPLDVFFIIPKKKVRTQIVYFTRDIENSKFKKYCENWDL